MSELFNFVIGDLAAVPAKHFLKPGTRTRNLIRATARVMHSGMGSAQFSQ